MAKWTKTSVYGTYEGPKGTEEEWKRAFEFAKMSRKQATDIMFGVVESPFEILGLETSATEDEIKKAFRTLVMIHHPDKGGDRDKFEKIVAAYTVLT